MTFVNPKLRKFGSGTNIDVRSKLNNLTRRRSQRDPSHKLFRTHQFLEADNPGSTDALPDKDIPITFSIFIERSDAGSDGVLFNVGDGTRAATLAHDGATLYFAVGSTGGAAAMITATSAIPALDERYFIAAAILPATGQLSLWVNGKLYGNIQTTNKNFGGDWCSSSAAIEVGEGTAVNGLIPVAADGALSDAVAGPLNIFDGQRPQQLTPLEFAQALFPASTLVEDDFETDLSAWTGSTVPYISADEGSAFGSKGLIYDITDTSIRNIHQQLGQDYVDTTTTFYLKAGDDFSLGNGGRIVFFIAYSSATVAAWQLELRGGGDDYFLHVYNFNTLSGANYLIASSIEELRQRASIQIIYRSAIDGKLEVKHNGNSLVDLSGDFSGKPYGNPRFRWQSYFLVSGKMAFDHFYVTDSLTTGLPPF